MSIIEDLMFVVGIALIQIGMVCIIVNAPKNNDSFITLWFFFFVWFGFQLVNMVQRKRLIKQFKQ